MIAQNIQELVALARKNAAYYRDVYKDVPDHVSDLEGLPVTDLDEYWRLALEDAANVLTAPFIDGTPLRSGGSTNVPKTCHVTRGEMKLLGRLTGNAWVAAGLVVSGDRIVNLYSFGGMYGGFQLANKAIEEAPVPVVHLPLSSTHPLDQVLQEIEAFQATALISPVFHVTRLASQISQSGGRPAPSIRMILYSGESLSPSVAASWRAAFPNAVIHPCLYSSCDSSGLAVLPHATRDPEEWRIDMATDAVYAVVQEASIIELLDDNRAVIREPGVPGHVFVTSLIRKLQPVIRYPLGDMASWVDYDARTFRFLGRGSLAVKLVGTWLPMMVLKEMLAEVLGTDVVGRLQCITRYEGLQTVLLFRMALERPGNEDVVREQVDGRLRAMSASWAKARDAGGIAPLRFEWVGIDGLVFLQRSGKLKEVIDERV